jgi:hypothetical protein
MAENQNQNKEFENMINEICKNIFPNMNLNEEQMKLFTEKFIKKDDGEEEESNDDDNDNDNKNNEDEDSNDDDNSDDNNNSDDNDEDDSNDNNDEDDDSDDNEEDDSNEDNSDEEEDVIFDEDDDDDDDANFDITNLNLSCNMCGEKIDESSNYVITPCTHFLHTVCIKNKILSENNKEKDIDAILDKAMDEFLNKENNEECEDCDVCKSLF